MKKKDFEKYLEALIIDGLIKEAQQDDMDFEAALRNISDEDFNEIVEETSIDVAEKPELPHTLREDVIFESAYDSQMPNEYDDSWDTGVEDTCVGAPADLQSLSKEFAKTHIKSGQHMPQSSVTEDSTRLQKRRHGWWSLKWQLPAVAAAVAVIVVAGFWISDVSRDRGITIGKCDMLYAYNIGEVDYGVMLSRGGGTDVQSSAREVGSEKKSSFPDVKGTPANELKKELPRMAKMFEEAETLQDVQIYGQLLTMGYLKVHDAKRAMEVLKEMKSRFATDPEDYEEAMTWCDQLLAELE